MTPRTKTLLLTQLWALKSSASPALQALWAFGLGHAVQVILCCSARCWPAAITRCGEESLHSLQSLAQSRDKKVQAVCALEMSTMPLPMLLPMLLLTA